VTGQYKVIMAALILLLVLMAIAHAASLLINDLRFTRAQTEVSFWGRGDYNPSQASVRRAGQALDDLLYASPNHPAYLSVRANSYVWQAYWVSDIALERQYTRQAVRLQIAALKSRPAHPHSRAKMIEYKERLHNIEY